MPLLIGTDEGLYRATVQRFDWDEPERVLDCGWVTGVETFDHVDGVFVTAASGAYRSVDGGESWSPLDIGGDERYWHESESEAWSVLATRDGGLYVGTNDPYLFHSPDGGETWTERRGFRELPSRGFWESPHSPHRARLRSLRAIPGRPGGLIAGIEAGGYHISLDGGRTWRDHRDTLMDDIHQILPLSEDVWVAATGYLDLDLEPHALTTDLGHAVGLGGLHRTTDGGDSWHRLDTGNEFAYVRRLFAHDGRLGFCGARERPTDWIEADHEAALFESTNFGRTFERVSYPGEPREYIDAWTVHDGALIGGGGLLVDVPDYRDVVEPGGRVIRRADGEYRTVGRLDANVSDLASVATSPSSTST